MFVHDLDAAADRNEGRQTHDDRVSAAGQRRGVLLQRRGVGPGGLPNAPVRGSSRQSAQATARRLYFCLRTGQPYA